MNLFDQLVTEALSNRKELSALRMVVEKELLHHDISSDKAFMGSAAQKIAGPSLLRATIFTTICRACESANK